MHNYLRAVAAAGTDDAEAVTDKLRAMDIDNFGETVRIRADGRVMRDLYLLPVNSPQQASSPTDYFQVPEDDTSGAGIPSGKSVRMPADEAVAVHFTTISPTMPSQSWSAQASG